MTKGGFFRRAAKSGVQSAAGCKNRRKKQIPRRMAPRNDNAKRNVDSLRASGWLGGQRRLLFAKAPCAKHTQGKQAGRTDNARGMQIPCVRRSGQGRDYVSLSSRRALSAEAHLGALRMKSRRAASQGTGSFAKRPRERQNRPHKDGISWQARCMPVGSRLVTN